MSDKVAGGRVGFLTTLSAFVFVVLVGGAVRTWLVMEPINSDPISYFLAGAGQHLDPDFHLALHHHHLRPLMTWAAWLPALIGGYSLQTFYTVVHAGALLTVLSWWVVATVLSGTRAAFLVAVLWTTSFAALSADLTIVPDNWGTSMALFGISAVVLAMRSSDPNDGQPEPRIWGGPVIWSLMSGLMLWASCAAKETFVIYVFAVFPIILLHRNRWQILRYVTLGLMMGGLVELVWFWVQFGDPLARVHYFKGIDAVIDGVNAKFEPLDLQSFLLRLPKVVHYTRSAESSIFLLAMLGFFLWCGQWKSLISRIKILLFIIPPAFVILAVKSIHPIQPYFDVVLRYYVPYLPFIYLAMADFFLWGWQWTARRGRRSLSLFFVSAGVLCYVVLITWNLLAAAEYLPWVKKNGFDTNAALQSALDADVAKTGTPKRLFVGIGMQPIAPLYFPRSDGWVTGKMTLPDLIAPDFTEPGYLILSWPRINSDGNERPFVLSHMFLDYPFVFRHNIHGAFTDLLQVGPRKIHRDSTELVAFHNKPWTLFDDHGRNVGAVAPTDPNAPLVLPKNGMMTLTSLLPDGQPDSALALPGGNWLHVRMNVTADGPFAILKVGLHDHDGENIGGLKEGQSLGVVYFERISGQKQNVSLVTFMTNPITRYDWVVRGEKAPIHVDNMVISLLKPDPLDRIAQSGRPW
ncbi:MAG: hypothetical protein HQL07_01215 [Nitrospirae bacterium]|nr:hypothetical protein [Magnetococcales bacterium]HAT51515.1 hypothetical protein [Alphaproteobacteria bacterium]